jgi:hypothetical protein
VGEIAMAWVLLVGAGLLLRSMQQLERVETGFDPNGLMSAGFSLPSTVYKTDEQQEAFFAAAEDRLRNIPGVTAAAMADSVPFDNNGGSSSFEVEGRVTPANDPGPHGNVRQISADYFKTLRIPMLRGREFGDDDRAKTQSVAVIDQTLARQYWPNQEPLGQRIRFGSGDPWKTIVGVVQHAKSSSLESDTTEGFYYLPLSQLPARRK